MNLNAEYKTDKSECKNVTTNTLVEAASFPHTQPFAAAADATVLVAVEGHGTTDVEGPHGR